MKAKKRYGQNFLVDNSVINEIINLVPSTNKDLIIEIGPGKGALTKYLVNKKSKFLAYEIDLDMKNFLDLYKNSVTVFYKDFLKSSLKDDIANIKYEKLYIVGNLPYYITTPIIEHVIKQSLNIESIIIMVQKEVASRFVAKHGSSEYGYFTLFLNYYFNAEMVLNVSRNSFVPAPKVDSAVVKLNSKKPIFDDPTEYFVFLKKSFSQKRKTLRNNLGDETFNKILSQLKQYGYSDRVRAEEISAEQFQELFNILNK